MRFFSVHSSLKYDVDNFIILIAAEYACISVQFHQDCDLGYCDKAPEYLKFHPNIHEVPFLETDLDTAGSITFGANNIARFFSQFKFVPHGVPFYTNGTQRQIAQIEQYISYSTVHLYRTASNYYKNRDKFEPPHSVEYENGSMAHLERALAMFNTALPSKTYLAGGYFTVADIIVTCHLHFAFTKILVKSFTSKFPHVERYFWHMVNEPNFHKILGNVEQFKDEKTTMKSESLGSSQQSPNKKHRSLDDGRLQ